MHNRLKLALISVSIFAATFIVGVIHAGTVTPPTSQEILDTQAAIQKRGPRVPVETYKKIVPVYLSKSGELTREGTEILGGTQKAQTSNPQMPPAASRGTQYQELIGAWKTGPGSSANKYEFQVDGGVVRSFQTFSGKDGKYNGTRTEDFQATQEAGKIVVSPKGKSDPQEWFEIAIPFDPAAPAATFVRVRNGERSETPFTLVKASAEPKSEASSAGTVQRTIAKRTVVFGQEKRRYFEQGSPVEISADRSGLPEWAEAVVIKGHSGKPDERWLIPREGLIEGEAFKKASSATNPAFPPSSRLKSQYLTVAEACFVPGGKGRNYVLMPGAAVRIVKRAQTSGEFGNVPGFEIRDGLDGLTAVLPDTFFANAAAFRPLPPAATAKLIGTGTEQAPYLIRTQQEFLAYAQDTSKWMSGVHARLESDIDLSGLEFDEALIAPFDRDSSGEKSVFNGILHGNGKRITGLKIITDRPYATAALFQEIGPDGAVKDLAVDAPIIETTGLNSGAAVLCYTNRGLLKNCRITGKVSTVSGLGTAGLCVENLESGKIVECRVGEGGKATISGWQAGGLASLNEGSIERSSAITEIRGDQSGGLVAANQRGAIVNSFAAGSIIDSADVGGLCGKNSGIIENCFSRTQIVPGRTSKNTVFGGLVGRSSGDAKVVSSFWNTDASGVAASEGGTGIAAAQCTEKQTFSGWDLNAVWSIGTNGPELRNLPTAESR